MASYVLGTPRPAPTPSSSSTERGGLQSGGQVQNVKAARVYVFGEGNTVEDDEDDVVEFEMRSRHKPAFPPPSSEEQAKPDFFEREINDGETLQAIALKYACNVSDLKRLNNLIQDQEFFALKTVKVPITRHGVLSESQEVQKMIQGGARPKTYSSHFNGATTMSDEDSRSDYFYDSESQHDFSDPETQMKVLKTLSIRENFSSQGKEAAKFLRKMDEDLCKLKTPRAERESLTEVISVLTNKSIRPLDRSVKTDNKYNGADCGMSWWSLVIYSLVICIVVPLVYLIYHYLS